MIAVCVGLTVVWTALSAYPGLAMLPATAGVAISPFCTRMQAVRDSELKIRQAEFEQEILARSQCVRVDGDYRLWSTPDGEFWVPGTSDRIIAVLLAQQRRNIYGDIPKGGIVLDCGAHVGTYAKKALAAGAAKVVAIDPSPEALECLRRNLAREVAEGRVVIVPKGVWDEEKQLVLYANGNGAAGDSFLEESPGARRIADLPVTTIDRIVADLGLPRVDLIKADVKGAGTRMIHGAAQTIRKFRPRIVVSTEEPPEDPAAIRAAVLAFMPDYRFRCGPCLFTGDEIRNDTIAFE
jgi:FkbM family methyltransferase